MAARAATGRRACEAFLPGPGLDNRAAPWRTNRARLGVTQNDTTCRTGLRHWVTPIIGVRTVFLSLILLIALALVFVKLGALSVWVTVLAAALQVLVALVAAVAALFGWKAWRRRRDRISFSEARVIHKRD